MSHFHKRAKRREVKNRQPMWAVVIGRPRWMIDQAPVASTQDNFIPLGYWFCELSGRTPRWHYRCGQIDRAASCPCMLCGLLRSSPPNAWVMACLCTVIRQTHTDATTVKSHQNQTHGQRHTQTLSKPPHRHSCSHYSQEGVVGCGGGWETEPWRLVCSVRQRELCL